MTFRFWERIAAAALLLLASGCATLEPPQVTQEPPEPYVRICREVTNRTEFQIALRKFVPQRASGPSIWLAGVSHLGAAEYFVELQNELDRKTLVIFEGINASRRESPRSNSASSASTRRDRTQRDMSEAEGLQPALARALGLKFQLESIDYSGTNFQNSDLSIPELRQLLVEQSTGSDDQAAAREFEDLLQAMQGQSLANALLRIAIPFLATSPALRGVTKLALIEVLGEIAGNPENIPGLPESAKRLMEVLLEHRNQRVMEDLRRELPRLKRLDSVAIFYGVAHMPDMERRLRSALHYRPAETRWLTAFAVDSEEAGISQAQMRFLRELLRRELRGTSN